MNYLSTTQTAKALGISRQAVAMKIKKKQLKAERIGFCWLISKKELEKHEKGNGRSRICGADTSGSFNLAIDRDGNTPSN